MEAEAAAPAVVTLPGAAPQPMAQPVTPEELELARYGAPPNIPGALRPKFYFYVRKEAAGRTRAWEEATARMNEAQKEAALAELLEELEKEALDAAAEAVEPEAVDDDVVEPEAVDDDVVELEGGGGGGGGAGPAAADA